MAGYTAVAENAGIAAVAAAATWISLHTADPGDVAASEVTGGTYVRKQTSWTLPPTGGSTIGAAVTLDIPAGLTIKFWAVHSAATGTGAQYYSGPLPANESFGASGTYQLTPTLQATN